MASGYRWSISVALLIGFFAWLFILNPLVQFGLPVALVGLAVVGLVVAVIVRSRQQATGAEPGTSVWEAIPSWQYAGRHVESGGLTRDEQERAIQDVQEEAVKRRGGGVTGTGADRREPRRGGRSG